MNSIPKDLREQYLKLIEQFGSPLYVYEGEVIQNQANRLASAFTGFRNRILYAAKALSNQSILKLIRSFGCGLDVVSIGEVRLGLLAGYKPNDILFTPGNVHFSEIEEAVSLGVHVNLDSISALQKFGQKYGSGYPVFIRINPHILAGGNPKIQTGHIDSKFGISVFQISEIEEVVSKYEIQVEGLHVHTGSEFLDANVFLEGAKILFQVAESFPDIRFIDFGSGFKVAYKAADVVTPVEDVGKKLAAVVSEFQKSRSQPVEIWFEPGKFLVSDSGVLLTTVTTVKRTPSSTFLGVDTGLNHLIRPMMYDAYHQIENISATGNPDQVFNIVGNICETDTLGYDRLLPETHEGQVLAIRNSGAYGFSMASNYNGRFRPAEVLLWKGKAFLIRRRDCLDDLLNGQIIAEI